jgi:hypothetical protein
MGYDMCLESADEATQKEIDAYQVRQAEINRKIEEFRDKAAKELGLAKPDRWDSQVTELLMSDPEYKRLMDKLYEEDDPAYFRLNIWGMGFMRAWMSKLGMLNEACSPPVFPDAESFGVREEEIAGAEYSGPDEIVDEWGEKHSPEWIEYQEATTRVKDSPPDTGFGIAWYKLGSNDGWLVTPQECNEAIEAFNAALPITETVEDPYAGTLPSADDKLSAEEKLENDLALLHSWIKWLERSSRSVGFRVW